jgi:hypothetical protein
MHKYSGSLFGERVRTRKIRTSKVKKNIENFKRIRTVKVSITRIRTSKDQNDDNYLWRSTYGYQGLWGVRLGSVRLGLVRIGLVRIGLVRIGLVRIGLVRIGWIKLGYITLS